MALHFLPGGPNSPPELAAALRRAFATRTEQLSARLGFAYATEKGLNSLIGALDRVPSWQNSRKKWIVGLHRGLTEPAALDHIRALPNSELRVYLNGNRLTYASLRARGQFHAKVIGIGPSANQTLSLVSASSANLTAAALAPSSLNFEAGLLLRDDFPDHVASSFFRWWRSAWDISVDASTEIIAQYTKLRDDYLEANPDTVADLDPPSEGKVKDAANLWIEAGAMSGGSRNQVEFSRDLAEFFGPPTADSRDLRIKLGNRFWDDRPLSHKTTTFGVEIWRLSLPTQSMSGLSYPGRILRFRRRQDDVGTYFELDVADRDEPKHRKWRKLAHRSGYIGETSGHRIFGIF